MEMMPGDPRQSIDFSADEVEALMIGARWVADHADPAMKRAAVRAMARLVEALPPDQAEAMRSAALFVRAYDDDDGDWGQDDGEEADSAPWCLAIRTGRRLSLVYRDLTGERSERIVWPFAMATYGRKDVLLGWCELRGDYRTFRIDRIVVARLLADRYPRSRETLLREWRGRPDIAHDQFVLSEADTRAA